MNLMHKVIQVFPVTPPTPNCFSWDEALKSIETHALHVEVFANRVWILWKNSNQNLWTIDPKTLEFCLSIAGVSI